MGRAGRVWRCIPDKAYIAVIGPSRAILVRLRKKRGELQRKPTCSWRIPK